MTDPMPVRQRNQILAAVAALVVCIVAMLLADGINSAPHPAARWHPGLVALAFVVLAGVTFVLALVLAARGRALELLLLPGMSHLDPAARRRARRAIRHGTLLLDGRSLSDEEQAAAVDEARQVYGRRWLVAVYVVWTIAPAVRLGEGSALERALSAAAVCLMAGICCRQAWYGWGAKRFLAQATTQDQ
jgi:hypothetical protein